MGGFEPVAEAFEAVVFVAEEAVDEDDGVVRLAMGERQARSFMQRVRARRAEVIAGRRTSSVTRRSKIGAILDNSTGEDLMGEGVMTGSE